MPVETRATAHRKLEITSAQQHAQGLMPPYHTSPSGKSDKASAELDEDIQKLPPEMRNTIYDFAFVAPVKDSQHTGVIISKAYKPPVGLQINRSRRIALARTYYNNTMFTTCSSPDPSVKPSKIFEQWFSSLDEDQRAQVKRIFYQQADDTRLGARVRDWDVPHQWRVVCEHIYRFPSSWFGLCSRLQSEGFRGVGHRRYRAAMMDQMGEFAEESDWTEDWEEIDEEWLD